MAGEASTSGADGDGSGKEAGPGEVVRGDTSRSVSRHIDAPPQVLFDLVADPTMHPVIDGSGTVRGSRAGRARSWLSVIGSVPPCGSACRT